MQLRIFNAEVVHEFEWEMYSYFITFPDRKLQGP